jgi:NAD(P)-dependent dehydrogenase (short-subunit alcohol dehydrogenase family)
MGSGGGLAGRVAAITGAGSGIGRSTALRFAAEGAAVAVVDVRADAAAETVALVAAAGGSAAAYTADVTVATQVDTAIDAAVARFGALHVLVNNAGTFGTAGSVEVADEQAWDRCMAVNVKGVYLSSRAALRHAPTGASIVNVASVAGLVGVGWAAAYCASKGAVVALTRQMALDLGPRGIRVNAVCPGTVLTPMSEPLLRMRGEGDLARGVAMTVEKYPLGRLGNPEEIAAVVAFLGSDDASFLTGAIVTADGGMTVC